MLIINAYNILKPLAVLLAAVVSFSANAESNLSANSCDIDVADLNMRYDNRMDYQNKNTPTDFFLLMFSNSPSFCQNMKRKGSESSVPFQCDSSNQFGWVVHGLWGESEQAYRKGDNRGHPRFCKGDLKPLPLATIKPYLCMSPGTKLLQGQWEKHGACDFETPEAYFDKTLELAEQFTLPPASLNPKKAIRWMRDNNPALKHVWLHQTRHEFGICFNKDFNVMSCPKKR
ncbi:ribonuclease T2 family protein [Enterovibrio sp. 27052020O]|uniref:ribonuclease T2 family protein n=1 Tax=Enterovibrio sp. 27052020O TaxID=3241166 RepID=UPI003890BE92